jgi:hypothetical protein
MTQIVDSGYSFQPVSTTLLPQKPHLPGPPQKGYRFKPNSSQSCDVSATEAEAKEASAASFERREARTNRTGYPRTSNIGGL